MNKVVLIGRFTKDPEIKFTSGKGTSYVKANLAVDKYNKNTGQNEADFIPVTFWGKQAENVANYQSKGSLIGISGKIHTGNYDANDGTKRYTFEVVAQEMKFLDSSKGNNSNNTSSSYNGGFDNDDMVPVDDGDIPF